MRSPRDEMLPLMRHWVAALSCLRPLAGSPLGVAGAATRRSPRRQSQGAMNSTYHMPVVDGAKLIGVVSIRDIVARRLLALETDVEVLRGQLLDQPSLTGVSH